MEFACKQTQGKSNWGSVTTLEEGMGVGGGREVQEERTYVVLMLILVLIWAETMAIL